MSRGVNKVILLGRIGKIESFSTSNGGGMVKASLVTEQHYTNKSTGEKVKEAEWHNLVIFGKLSEVAKQYVNKGTQLYVEGRLNTNKFMGKDGIERYSTQVIVENLQICGNKEDSTKKEPNGNKGYDPVASGGYKDLDDDDLPF